MRSNRPPISHRFHAWCCLAAVLAAISIPIFTNQLEKAREATDLSNIRAAYAEVSAEGLLDDTSDSIKRTVALKQQQNGWQTTGDLKIGEVDVSRLAVGKGVSVTVSWVPT